MANTLDITEADILEEIVKPRRSGLTPDAARTFLGMTFSKDATKQIRHLLQKNNRGTITARERVILERYERVGQFLDLIHAWAKLSLQESGNCQ